jgi:hypothetical protein
MDIATARMLAELPLHLRQRGWTFIRDQSREYRTLGSTWYIAVYERPYDPNVDHGRFANPTRDGRARVSTNSMRSPSWADAYNDAVQMMEEIDRRRKPGGS